MSLASVNASWPAAAGDTIRLVGTFTNTLMVGGGGALGNPVTIYFESGANFTLSAGVASAAINLGNNNYVTVDGGGAGLIAYTDNGTALAYQNYGASGILGTPTIGGITIQNLSVSNIYVHVPGTADTQNPGYGIGLSGSLTNIDVHGVSVYSAFRGILIGYNSSNSGGIALYANNCISNDVGIIVGSGSAGAVVSGVSIYGNHFSGASEWDTSNDFFHEDGIYVWAEHSGAYATNVNIYANSFGPDMGHNATADIYLSSDLGRGIFSVGVYNNVAYDNGTSHGLLYTKECTGVKVCNNTVASGTIGFYFYNSTNILGRNNLMANLSAPVGIADAQLGNLQWDYSLYYNLNPWGGSWGDMSQHNWSQWQGLGMDAHSLYDPNPLFVSTNNYNFQLQSGSPAIGAGPNLSGIFTTDYAGNPRPSAGGWTIGAYEAATILSPAPVVSLTASLTNIFAGASNAPQFSKLSWTSANTTNLVLSSIGPVSLTGSTNVSPSQDTTYTITAKGANGTNSASVSIMVGPAPPSQLHPQ